MTPIVVTKLADEYRYLDQWFGPGKHRLAGRALSYGPNGRVYDVLTVGVGRNMYRVTFDATRIRPPAPAGAAQSVKSSSWLLPLFIVAVTVTGLCLYDARK